MGFAARIEHDGDCPLVIPYTFTFDGQKQPLSRDKLGQSIIVEYVLVTTPSATTDGWPPARRPQFAWYWGDSPPLNSEYIDGLACNNDDITGGMDVISDNPECPAVLRFGISAVPAKPNRSNVRGAAGLHVVRPRPGSILVEGDRH